MMGHQLHQMLILQFILPMKLHQKSITSRVRQIKKVWIGICKMGGRDFSGFIPENPDPEKILDDTNQGPEKSCQDPVLCRTLITSMKAEFPMLFPMHQMHFVKVYFPLSVMFGMPNEIALSPKLLMLLFLLR
jgi:hypothetical protein